MKMKVVALVASGLITAALWGYSQQMGSHMYGSPGMNQSHMQHMRNHPMMGWYTRMGQTQVYPSSPMSILAWKDELGLSDSQASQLKAVEERAIAEAKAVLTNEQRIKLANMTKGWKPMSIDQYRNLMNR